MIIKAYKYQGAGNDFVILDNRENKISLDNSQIKFLCDRRFGIGGDGLMLLGNSSKYDFSMRYFNSDGNEGSMCGNGGRCLVTFAAHRGVTNFEFEAIDGYHKAKMIDYSPHRCIVELGMIPVDSIKEYSTESFFLNTGSPHLVIFVKDLMNYDVDSNGKYWRHHPDFIGGTNVNFVEVFQDHLFVRTYERGVEAETYACGTGVTASALAHNKYKGDDSDTQKEVITNIDALGDKLQVKFVKQSQDTYSDIFLTGPATYVFDCLIEV